jgi:hypothetical protein
VLGNDCQRRQQRHIQLQPQRTQLLAVDLIMMMHGRLQHAAMRTMDIMTMKVLVRQDGMRRAPWQGWRAATCKAQQKYACLQE